MPIELPALTTQDGVLARVFIMENTTPLDHIHYNETEALKCMRAQRAVLQNRLAHLDRDPAHFGAAGATNLTDIVLGTNPQAVAGFSRGAHDEVVISAQVQTKITDALNDANTGPPGKMSTFIHNAINTAHTPAADPFAGISKIGGVEVFPAVYFWRTATHAGPGGNTIAIPDASGGLIAGIRFYMIKK